MSRTAETAEYLPESLYVQIVRGMSRTIGLSLATCFHQPAQAMFAAWWLANPWIAIAAAFAGLMGIVRCVALLRWSTAREAIDTKSGARRWEAILVGASIPFSLGLGTVSGVTMMTGDAVWAMVEALLVVGYASG